MGRLDQDKGSGDAERQSDGVACLRDIRGREMRSERFAADVAEGPSLTWAGGVRDGGDGK